MWRNLMVLTSVMFLYAGCKRTDPDELMKQAQSAYDMKNYSMAIEYYQRVADEHPKSLQGETSAFRVATIYNNDLHDAQKAIDAYRGYLSGYTEGPRAPMALFLIGFLYNNEVKNLDSASAVYRRFLAMYPDHELAKSARFELENLGKPPEALIPQEHE